MAGERAVEQAAIVGEGPVTNARWNGENPDQVLASLRERLPSFVPAYEEMLEDRSDGMSVVIHTRRLTPLGNVIQVFENEAFFESGDGRVLGRLRFYCTETIDAIGETPTSFFYMLYRNAGPEFERIAQRVLQYHAEHSSPMVPRNETLSGLYGNSRTALMHVTACALQPDWREHDHLVKLLSRVEGLRISGERFLVHPDNPYRNRASPGPADLTAWEAAYEDELAVQLARRIGVLTLAADAMDPDLRDELASVARDLSSDQRPVLVIDETQLD